MNVLNWIDQIIFDWLSGMGMKESIAKAIADFSGFLIIIVLSIIAFYVLRKILVTSIHAFATRSKSEWDDKLVKRGVFRKLAYIAPALILLYLTPLVIPDWTFLISIIQLAAKIYIFTISMLVIFSVLDAVNDIYQEFSIARKRPIKSFLQVIKIVIIIIYIIILINLLFVGERNYGWLAGLGAFSAVFLLIFRDPILGFVGGLQLAFNDMLRIGDWIQMDKYGADGTVTEINLTAVKVQNWNKTISTIPTYALVTDSYKNWRGMEESGGRRIKRSIMIDMNTVKFCTPGMLERFAKIEHVSEYVKTTEERIKKYNEENKIDNSVLVNGRRQTNIGVFRAYLKGYLRNHPKVNQEMTFLVRQLQPSEKGIPIEVYVFSKVQAWADYEDIQSDIFDHILAVVPEFDLKVYQNPSGSDVKAFLEK
jgi:miniconductance mechanosensitive channel